MYTFDSLTGGFVPDSAGALATRLLAAHYCHYWKILVGLLYLDEVPDEVPVQAFSRRGVVGAAGPPFSQDRLH